MATKLTIALSVLVACANAQLETVDGKIKITTVTTSGCSDTVDFITNQLGPAYMEYGNFLELEFVPWGRTQRNPDGSLTCQFQERDCWANRLHRCVLNLLGDNNDAAMHYMSCEFASPYPSFISQSYLCAIAVGLNIVDVDYCMSTTGDSLEAPAEQAAQGPMASINFVPAIVFNDQIDGSLHTQARQRLVSMICFALAEDPSTGVTDCSLV